MKIEHISHFSNLYFLIKIIKNFLSQLCKMYHEIHFDTKGEKTIGK